MRTMRTRWSYQYRLLLTVLCLFAASVQGFIAQTHFHAPAAEIHASAVQSQSESDNSKHGHHTGESCPLCQVVMHGGGAPLLRIAMSLPVQALQFVAVAAQVLPVSIATVSYSWQSRGPPSVLS